MGGGFGFEEDDALFLVVELLPENGLQVPLRLNHAALLRDDASIPARRDHGVVLSRPFSCPPAKASQLDGGRTFVACHLW
jgi:hypothetical protein